MPHHNSMSELATLRHCDVNDAYVPSKNATHMVPTAGRKPGCAGVAATSFAAASSMAVRVAKLAATQTHNMTSAKE